MVAWAFELAEHLLREPLPRRWVHVQGVADRARSVSVLFSTDDATLLVEAAVLHDIGYSPALALTGFHPLDGARYLREATSPERLCALVAHHSCSYLEARLRGLSKELDEWGDEETSLRDALWWADMTTTPDGERTNINDRIEEIQNRYGPTDLVTAFIAEAKPELTAAVERTEERLRAAGLAHLAK
ncbi:HD domain-containing protein [Saccharothrix deserti]|uniref:HD domain-containing protein n=1 Tax=Saccharothrix deserti TaxID=2593674 RepID=UPI00131CDE13|nr:HD domain-containing protein [Saccharothrix deserti]